MEQFNIATKTNETFVLFHGTGGNEYSLLQVAGDINPQAGIRAYIGNVGTGKERRFFAPLDNGQLPRANFDAQVEAFLSSWQHDKPAGKLTMIGYSNGANFLLGLLEREPAIAQTVILLHPSNLRYHFAAGADTRIIITAGARDTLAVAGESLQLARQLEGVFPHTTFKLFDHGHEIVDAEINYIAALLK